MTTIDGLPILSRGSHPHPQAGACFMEYTALLAGHRFSDHPECTDEHLAATMMRINDSVVDADRDLLVPLLGRAIGLKGRDPLEINRLRSRVVQILGAYMPYSPLLGYHTPESLGLEHLRRLGEAARRDQLPHRELAIRRVAFATQLHEAYEQAMAELGIPNYYKKELIRPLAEVKQLVGQH